MLAQLITPPTSLDGGPLFTFNEAISFTVTCEDPVEVDSIPITISSLFLGAQPAPFSSVVFDYPLIVTADVYRIYGARPKQ